ncbi:carcinoembryonic antigen-related cell adhesion molecule 8-like [Archocentrus centrarchus]|uniref:carcinoembryonic antigen-related cell adhesion molecule 8-like n=1 Tax=Archocentrus centrarchus TaxID=63155 RepID=UPI0011E9F60A|nr:carcinoembryonic antigen-related cell adhesion molecule 8-like [Archocentrus centrarchus]
MGNVTVTTCGKSLYCVLLVALIGVPGLVTAVQISWTGSVTAGFTTTFTCSSTCFPNCTYTWSFQARTVNGSTLTWTPDGLDDIVALRCTVFNPRTKVYTSTTTTVEIKNQMSVQTSPPNTLPSLNQSLNLVCHNATSDDPQGLSHVVWYIDGQKVTLRENMWLLRNNLTLHFDSLLPSDAGFYQCLTYLPTSHTRVISSDYLLTYDPWKVSISGPDTVFPGQLFQFTCLTSCALNVECTVRWQFRGGFPIGTYFSVHENELKWTPSIPGTFQNFTCIAENKAAGRSAETTKMVAVKGVLISGSEVVQLSGLFGVILILGLWVL